MIYGDEEEGGEPEKAEAVDREVKAPDPPAVLVLRQQPGAGLPRPRRPTPTNGGTVFLTQ